MSSRRNDKLRIDQLPLADEPVLWSAVAGGDPAARGRLIEAYLPFARVIAAKSYAARTEFDQEFEDYLQFGTIGLIEAVDRFDAGLGLLFKTFAFHRISGAILNGLEHMSEKRIQVATERRLAGERRRSVITPAPLPARDLFQQLADVAVSLALGYVIEGGAAVYFHEESTLADTRYSSLELAQVRKQLLGLLHDLPDQERRVIKYHYLNQVPFNEIAETMGLTRGRISQIHHRALERLRTSLQSVRTCDVAW